MGDNYLDKLEFHKRRRTVTRQEEKQEAKKVSLMIDKMTTEGDGIKNRDLNERRNSLGFYIQNQSKLYGNKDFVSKLNSDEFATRVKFNNGIPLIVLDLLDFLIGTSFLSSHKKLVSPARPLERFDYTDELFVETKALICEEFLPSTWTVFNSLGEMDFNLKALIQSQEDCMIKQYITVESITRNLWKVFGVQNEFFSYMLFSLLTRGSPQNGKVNYLQFLRKMLPLWPKKGDKNILNGNDEHKKKAMKKQRESNLHHFVFDLFRITGSDCI